MLVACGGGGESASTVDPGATAGAAGAGGASAGGGGRSGQGGSAGVGGAGAGAGGAAAGGGGASGGKSGAGGGTSGAGGAGKAGGGGASGAGGVAKAGTSGAGAAGGPGGIGGGGSAGNGGAPPVDACASVTPACPKAPQGYTEGDGLAAQDRCAFPLDTASTWSSLSPLVAALEAKLPKRTVADVLADTNRDPVVVTSVPGKPPGVSLAFRWDDAENDKTTWIPQGITGSADSTGGLVAGKRVVVVSFYFDTAAAPAGADDKGVRLAFVDVTNPAKPSYRFVLLVAPSGTPSAPSFTPVGVHAGGIAWYQRWLYVADTGNGFRVFDTQRLLEVDTSVDEIGCAGGVCRGGLYKYVLPQVGGYKEASACGPRFSWVSLERTAGGAALVSGEYCSTTACSSALSGRIFRWPLDPSTGLLAPGRSWPSHAWLMGQVQVQGGALRGGVAYLSSSAPAAGAGALYRVAPGKSATSAWIDSPEDLMVDEANDLLFSLSEAVGQRFVFGAKLTSYPPP